jgi:hypothetical protein
MVKSLFELFDVWGWLLVVALILGIVILISVLSK